MNALTRYTPLLGRILLALIFVSAGYGKIRGFDGTVGYIASQGVPLPTLAAIGAIVIELGGGLLLIAGWKARWAAAAMALFTLIAAVIFHAFWAAPADQAMNQSIHFWKNIAIVGGLLYVVAYGAGPLSVEHASQASADDTHVNRGAPQRS
jgi:putative oxidoreductase